MLMEHIEFEGKKHLVEWVPGVPVPASDRITQVSAICLTAAGQVVLVSADGKSWGLPGGHPEPGEAPEETLRREMSEEACCTVDRAEYLGYQKCTPEGRMKPDCQLRYKCLVKLEVFRPRHEIGRRRLVPAVDFLKELDWGKSPIAAELARLALGAGV